MIDVWGYTCERCGHEWTGRGDEDPKTCPAAYCKSPYWDRPRKDSVKEKMDQIKGEKLGRRKGE